MIVPFQELIVQIIDSESRLFHLGPLTKKRNVRKSSSEFSCTWENKKEQSIIIQDRGKRETAALIRGITVSVRRRGIRIYSYQVAVKGSLYKKSPPKRLQLLKSRTDFEVLTFNSLSLHTEEEENKLRNLLRQAVMWTDGVKPN